MQITISQSALSRELALLASVADKKSTIPILSNVRMEATADGLTLTATDLECGLIAHVPASVTEGGSICLPVKRLSDYVRLLPDGDVSIVVGPNNHATVKGGKSRSRIPGEGSASFPELPSGGTEVLTMDARAFSRQLASVKYAVSTEASRFSLAAVLMQIKDGGLRLVATDSHRLTYSESPCNENPVDVLVPLAAIGTIAKLADVAEGGGSVIVSQDDNHLFFAVGERTLVARKTSGNFPDYGRVLPKQDGSGFSVNRDEFSIAIDRVRQFAETGKDIDPTLSLTFTNGAMSVRAESFTNGEAEESVACGYEGAEVALGMNPTYLLDFLGSVSDDSVTMFCAGPAKAMELRAGNVRYIAMPKRLK